jgi:signal transduction histidine kinase
LDELRAVLDAVPAAVWIARDPGCARIDANRLGADLVRRAQDENFSLTGPSDERPVFRVLQDGEEVRSEDLAMQVAARTGREVRGVEQSIVFEDGTAIHLLGNATPLADHEGRPRGAVGAFIDITDRKLAEDALREREERLRAVLENMSEGLVIFDTNGSITYENPSSLRIHANRLRGDGLDQLALSWRVRKYPDGSVVPPDEWAIPRVLRGERVQNESFFVDCLEQAYRSFVGLYNGAPVYDAGGKLAYGFLTIKDITEQARAEAALRDANDRLRDADRRKDEFLAMVSHELRNPLAPIRNASYLLTRVVAGNEQAQRAVRTIERQTEHLTRLVDDLLDLTRIVHGKLALQRERVDLRVIAAHAVADFRVRMQERGVTLNVVLADDTPFVEADSTRVTQVLTNLLHNAAKFTSRGDAVTVTVRRHDTAAEVEVADTGAGIDPGFLPTIFEPFVQGERTIGRTERGLGLGLALVKGIVEAHGGTVHAESAGAGNGATFTMRFPSVSGPTVTAPGDTRPSNAKRRSILVVDDDQDTADTLADLLRLLGHDVAVAYDGASAIEKIRAWPPDAVLCDIGMPGIDGHELAFAIRAMAPDAMQMIAVTGYAQPEDVKRAIAAGFDGHVAKPADIAQIERMLR